MSRDSFKEKNTIVHSTFRFTRSRPYVILPFWLFFVVYLYILFITSSYILGSYPLEENQIYFLIGGPCCDTMDVTLVCESLSSY